jgi:hypothetical protein
MARISISFTKPNPLPFGGFLVRYRPVTETTWSEETWPSNITLPQFLTGLLEETVYAIEVSSICENGVSTPGFSSTVDTREGSDNPYVLPAVLQAITTQHFNQWNQAYQWGDHTEGGYQQTNSYIPKEKPTGSIDGVNRVFVLTHMPVLNTEHIFLNGLLQDNGIKNDYIIEEHTITFTPDATPQTGDKLVVTYYK